MADCTKTVEFFRAYYKICNAAVDCNSCMLRNIGDAYYCLERVANNTEAAIAIVQKWSDEHPVLTQEGKLRELLPNARIYSIIEPRCPYDLFGEIAPSADDNCSHDCVTCWAGEYKED